MSAAAARPPVVDNVRVHVYLPMTLSALADVLRDGAVRPAPIDGFTVTAGLRAELAGEDDEELEYTAQNRAAANSLPRLAGDPAAPRRRVVLVVDVEPDALDDADGLATGAVVLREEVDLARVVSALVDDPVAAADVARVIEAPDDAEALSDLEDHQLLWFAAQELADLVTER